MEAVTATIADARSGRAPHAPVERRAARAWLVLLIVLTSALVATLSYVSLRSSREAYSHRALDAVQNIASGLQQAVASDLDRVTIALDAFALAYERANARGPADDATIEQLVAEQQRLVPARATLRVTNADGDLRFYTRPANFSDRAYFRQARDAQGDDVVVSEPLRSRIDGEWVVMVVRRLTAPDGHFAGVVGVDLRLSHFERLLSTVQLGPQGAISLRNSELALVTRLTGSPTAAPADIGSRNVSSELRQALQTRPQAGGYIARTALDGIERANAYRRLDRYPLMVIVGMSTADYLTAWHREVAVVGLLATLVVAALAMSSMFIWRAWQRAADNARTRNAKPTVTAR